MSIDTPDIKPIRTPTRSDASKIGQVNPEAERGLSVITNAKTGELAKRAQTGKTITTGGTTSKP